MKKTVGAGKKIGSAAAAAAFLLFAAALLKTGGRPDLGFEFKKAEVTRRPPAVEARTLRGGR